MYTSNVKCSVVTYMVTWSVYCVNVLRAHAQGLFVSLWSSVSFQDLLQFDDDNRTVNVEGHEGFLLLIIFFFGKSFIRAASKNYQTSWFYRDCSVSFISWPGVPTNVQNWSIVPVF